MGTNLVRVLLLEGKGWGWEVLPWTSQTRLCVSLGPAVDCLSFPGLNVKGNAFYNHEPLGPPLSFSLTWLLGIACGLQSHGMSPGENHFSRTRPDRSPASQRRLIIEPSLEAVQESLWNSLSSDTLGPVHSEVLFSPGLSLWQPGSRKKVIAILVLKPRGL